MASQPNCVALACVLKHTDGFADEDTLGFTASAEMCFAVFAQAVLQAQHRGCSH